MVITALWAIGSAILILLGSIHLYYTFFSDKFSPANSQLIPGMKATSPKLTKGTSMWKAWIGFNASHSSGAIFIGGINLYLIFAVFDSLVDRPLFFIINIITVLFYVWLAKRYWFRIPFLGILLTFFCYLLAFLIVLLNY